jgi:hypothetical protein
VVVVSPAEVVVVVSASDVDVGSPDNVVVVGSSVDSVVSEPPAQPATTNANAQTSARFLTVETVDDRAFTRNK